MHEKLTNAESSLSMLHGPIAGWLTILILAMPACSNVNTSRGAPSEAAIPGLTENRQVQEILANSCFDCHSNERAAHWNVRLAPSYLFGLSKAREALNFSEWPGYQAKRKQAELRAIALVVGDRSMPPGDYDLVHPGARLDPAQRQSLIAWTAAMLAAH